MMTARAAEGIHGFSIQRFSVGYYSYKKSESRPLPNNRGQVLKNLWPLKRHWSPLPAAPLLTYVLMAVTLLHKIHDFIGFGGSGEGVSAVAVVVVEFSGVRLSTPPSGRPHPPLHPKTRPQNSFRLPTRLLRPLRPRRLCWRIWIRILQSCFSVSNTLLLQYVGFSHGSLTFDLCLVGFWVPH